MTFSGKVLLNCLVTAALLASGCESREGSRVAPVRESPEPSTAGDPLTKPASPIETH